MCEFFFKLETADESVISHDFRNHIKISYGWE